MIAVNNSSVWPVPKEYRTKKQGTKSERIVKKKKKKKKPVQSTEKVYSQSWNTIYYQHKQRSPPDLQPSPNDERLTAACIEKKIEVKALEPIEKESKFESSDRNSGYLSESSYYNNLSSYNSYNSYTSDEEDDEDFWWTGGTTYGLDRYGRSILPASFFEAVRQPPKCLSQNRYE